MAFVFGFVCLVVFGTLILLCLSIRSSAACLSPAGVERSWGGGCVAAAPQRSGTPAGESVVGFPPRFHLRPAPWRKVPIAFSLRATASFSANGFKPDFSARNRCFVASVTSVLANTRAKGVWAAP
jgi:hypothetical protein